jgi:hypothetical protein
MIDQLSFDTLLRRVDTLDREVRQLRRELLHGVRSQPAPARKATLFGSVKAGDVTDALIEDAQHDLFRSLNDL